MKVLSINYLANLAKNHGAAAILYGLCCYIYINFIVLVCQTALNLPIWDDFDSVLFFVNQYLEEPSLQNRIALVLAQHNEHRIIINKLLTLLSLVLFSEVNFRFLIFCAVFALLLVPPLLIYRSSERAPALLVASAIMLQPQYGDGLNWVTTCLASFSLLLLAVCCGQLSLTKGRWFLLTIPLLLIALKID